MKRTSTNNTSSHPSSLIPINEYEVFYDLSRDDKSFLDNLSRKEGHVCSEKILTILNGNNDKRTTASSALSASSVVIKEGVGDEKNSTIFNRWVNSYNSNYNISSSNSNSNSSSSSSNSIMGGHSSSSETTATATTAATTVESKRKLFYDSMLPSLILIVFVIRQNIPDEILPSDGSLSNVVTSW